MLYNRKLNSQRREVSKDNAFYDHKTLAMFLNLPSEGVSDNDFEDSALSDSEGKTGAQSNFSDAVDIQKVEQILERSSSDGNIIQQFAKYLDAKANLGLSNNFETNKYSCIIFCCIKFKPELLKKQYANIEHPFCTLLSTTNIQISDKLIVYIMITLSMIEGYLKLSEYLKNDVALGRLQQYIADNPKSWEYSSFEASMLCSLNCNISFMYSEAPEQATKLIYKEFNMVLKVAIKKIGKLSDSEIKDEIDYLIARNPQLAEMRDLVSTMIQSSPFATNQASDKITLEQRLQNKVTLMNMMDMAISRQEVIDLGQNDAHNARVMNVQSNRCCCTIL